MCAKKSYLNNNACVPVFQCVLKSIKTTATVSEDFFVNPQLFLTTKSLRNKRKMNFNEKNDYF